MEYSFVRYLESKRSVDDRALNRGVWQALRTQLDQSRSDTPMRVMEVGGGIGTMLQRFLEQGVFDQAHYTLLDQDKKNIEEAELRTANAFPEMSLDFVNEDVFDYFEKNPGHKWDLVIAHAFLDLVNIAEFLSQLVGQLADQALCYFTINYDGVTIFEPEIDAELDSKILRLYHQSMDTRQKGDRLPGGSWAGRHLFLNLQRAGLHILEAGSSDWVVFPRQGKYLSDEAYFLHHILHFIEGSLSEHPEMDNSIFTNWLARRHEQVESGELIYIAHQLDFLATRRFA